MSEWIIEIIPQLQCIIDLCQWDAFGRSFSDTVVALSIPVFSISSKSETIAQCLLSAIRFLFLNLTCFMAENVLSHTYVLPNIECIFSAKSFPLGNLSLLSNVQKLCTVS